MTLHINWKMGANGGRDEGQLISLGSPPSNLFHMPQSSLFGTNRLLEHKELYSENKNGPLGKST